MRCILAVLMVASCSPVYAQGYNVLEDEAGYDIQVNNESMPFRYPDVTTLHIQTPDGEIVLEYNASTCPTEYNVGDRCDDQVTVLSIPDGFVAPQSVTNIPENNTDSIRIMRWQGM